MQGNGWYFFAWDFKGLSQSAAKHTTGVYLSRKFEVSSIILASFRQGGGGSFTPPPLTSKRTPIKPTQIRVNIGKIIWLLSIWLTHLISKVFPTGLPKFTSIGFMRIFFKSIIVLELSICFCCYEKVFVGITYGLLYVYS